MIFFRMSLFAQENIFTEAAGASWMCRGGLNLHFE